MIVPSPRYIEFIGTMHLIIYISSLEPLSTMPAKLCRLNVAHYYSFAKKASVHQVS